MLHAWALCREGDGVIGQALLDELNDERSLSGRARNRAQLAEARAACHFTNGRPEQALEQIDRALATQPEPGAVLEASRSTPAQGAHSGYAGPARRGRAGREKMPDKAFVDLGLNDHPRLDALAVD